MVHQWTLGLVVVIRSLQRLSSTWCRWTTLKLLVEIDGSLLFLFFQNGGPYCSTLLDYPA